MLHVMSFFVETANATHTLYRRKDQRKTNYNVNNAMQFT